MSKKALKKIFEKFQDSAFYPESFGKRKKCKWESYQCGQEETQVRVSSCELKAGSAKTHSCVMKKDLENGDVVEFEILLREGKFKRLIYLRKVDMNQENQRCSSKVIYSHEVDKENKPLRKAAQRLVTDALRELLNHKSVQSNWTDNPKCQSQRKYYAGLEVEGNERFFANGHRREGRLNDLISR